MLGQAGRLSERQRVKPRLSLLLIRIRYFVVSLIPWIMQDIGELLAAMRE